MGNLRSEFINETGIEQSLLESIVDYLIDSIDARRIIIFGSRAKHSFKERSDIDIAVEVPIETVLPIVQINEDINSLLTIDLVNLNKVQDHLKNEITKEGILLYEKT